MDFGKMASVRRGLNPELTEVSKRVENIAELLQGIFLFLDYGKVPPSRKMNELDTETTEMLKLIYSLVKKAENEDLKNAIQNMHGRIDQEWGEIVRIWDKNDPKKIGLRLREYIGIVKVLYTAITNAKEMSQEVQSDLFVTALGEAMQVSPAPRSSVRRDVRKEEENTER